MAQNHKDKVVFIHEGKLNENEGAKVLQYFLSQQGHLSLRRLIRDGMCLQADNVPIAGWPGHVSYFRSRLLTHNAGLGHSAWAIESLFQMHIMHLKNIFFHWTTALEQKAEMQQNLFCGLLN